MHKNQLKPYQKNSLTQELSVLVCKGLHARPCTMFIQCSETAYIYMGGKSQVPCPPSKCQKRAAGALVEVRAVPTAAMPSTTWPATSRTSLAAACSQGGLFLGHGNLICQGLMAALGWPTQPKTKWTLQWARLRFVSAQVCDLGHARYEGFFMRTLG